MRKPIVQTISILLCLLLLSSCQSLPREPASSESDGNADTIAIPSSQPPSASDEKSNVFSLQVENLELVQASDGTTVQETLTADTGKQLILDAQVDTKAVQDLHQYKYELVPVTEELRSDLFTAYFGSRASEAIYDERNNVWELHNSDAIGDYYLYHVYYPMAGGSVPDEQAFMLEYRDVNLYPFDDNLLPSVADCDMSLSLDDAIAQCDSIMNSIAPQADYVVDTVLPYGTDGRRPYYKIFYRRIADGIPIIGYNDFYYMVDDNGIQTISGALFSIYSQTISSKILSLEDAVSILRENMNLVSFYEEDLLQIGKISMEYFVTKTETGEVLITPAWRFQIGVDADTLGAARNRVLAVDAVTGELIQGERGNTF